VISQAAAVISRILPPQAVAAEAFSDVAGVRLFGAEEAALGGASLRRYAEFSTGRACARAARAGSRSGRTA
jgi:hypothetical protein